MTPGPEGMRRVAEFAVKQKKAWSKAKFLAETYDLGSHIDVILMALDAFEEALEKTSHVREEEEKV